MIKSKNTCYHWNLNKKRSSQLLLASGVFTTLCLQISAQLPENENSSKLNSKHMLLNFNEDHQWNSSSDNVNSSFNNNSAIPDTTTTTWKFELDYLVFGITIASCFFLCLTILTYVCLPSLLNIHGKTILCHLICLLLSFILQMVGDFILPETREKGPTYYGITCWITGFLLYFFTLSSNFWLTIVNFDIWSTFARTHARKNKFSFYCALSVGVPLALCIIVYILEVILPDGHDFKPSIASTRCFLPLSPTNSILIYFYLVVGSLLLFNTVIFVWTMVVLCSIQSTTARVQTSSKSMQIFQRCFLFFKLFCVMGTTWTINISLWLCGAHKMKSSEKSGIIVFFELFNVSHGFCYFIVFVCKPSIFKLFKKRFCPSAEFPISSTSATGNGNYSNNTKQANARALKTNTYYSNT